jgi:phosphate starvation-inducible protein PhoH and related proteins
LEPKAEPESSRNLELPDGPAAREMVGELGRHLVIIGRSTATRISQRGVSIRIVGAAEDVALAERVVQQLYAVAASGSRVAPVDVDQACRLLRAEPEAQLLDYQADTILIGARKKPIFPRTPMQRRYLRAFAQNDIVFGLGPAGTGKTYLAMAVGVSLLLKEKVRRIVLCRPAVEAGEKLGFLPGDLAEKVNPYLRPLYDALHDMVDDERAARLVERGVIEVAPLAFMRGRTLNDSFIILDEAQNATEAQMKMFLTRLGPESRAAITGDLSQVDLPRGVHSGLAQAVRLLEGIEGISMIRFGDVDIVRHPLVGDIVRAYDRDGAARARAERGDRA